MLKEDHKTKRMGSALKFLTLYAQEEGEFMDSIVTGDEIWGFHHTAESNQQSLQWHHTHSPRTKKNQNFYFGEKNHGVHFLGQKRHSPGRLHASWRNN